MTIGEVARRSGMAASAIRYYEELKILPAPRRAGGRRIYDERILNLLAVVAFARRTGFTLEEVRELLAGKGWRRLAIKKLAVLAAQIARTRAMMRLLRRIERCRCADFDECGRKLRRI